MKDKIIKVVHFDYANQLVKILGFVNLADYETILFYNNLKTTQDKICQEFTKTLQLFKKIFPQEGFDLRKINYSFDNIDQVMAFIKKIFGYLGITYIYERKNGIPTLRLIPPNNLYKNYIMKLRNIPQNEDIYISQEKNEVKEVKDYKTEIIEPTSMKYLLNYLKKPFEKKYTVMPFVRLSSLDLFDYFKWIGIKMHNGHKLPINTNIKLEIGGSVFLEKNINNLTQFDDLNYYKFDIDFSNNLLFKYQEMCLTIKTNKNIKPNLFDIIICGNGFKSTVPKTNFSPPYIKFDHDSKWYIEGEFYTMSMANMVRRIYTNDLPKKIDCVDTFKKFKKNNQVQISNIQFLCEENNNENNNEPLIFIDDIIPNKNDGLLFLVDNNFLDYIKKNEPLISSPFSVGSIYNVDSNKCFVICEITSKSTCKLIYDIHRVGDLIKHIDLKLLNNNVITGKCIMKAWIENNSSIVYDLELIEKSNGMIRLTPFDNEIINMHLHNFVVSGLQLVLEISKTEFDDFKFIDISYGSIFINSEIRKKIQSEHLNKKIVLKNV